MDILGKVVRIRAIEDGDCIVFHRYINDPELERFENSFSFPVSMEQQKKWINDVNVPSNSVKLAIEYEGEAVGYTNILNIDWKNRVAWNGIRIFDESHRRKGLARDSIMAIMRFCFCQLGLNRLETQILEYNVASYHLYVKKCGWKVEGIRRQCVFRDNRYYDVHYVSILKNEYEELINKTDYWNKSVE